MMMMTTTAEAAAVATASGVKRRQGRYLRWQRRWN